MRGMDDHTDDRIFTHIVREMLAVTLPSRPFRRPSSGHSRKASHVATAIVKRLPQGHELRAEIDGSIIRSRLGVEAESAEWRTAFEARGWTSNRE